MPPCSASGPSELAAARLAKSSPFLARASKPSAFLRKAATWSGDEPSGTRTRICASTSIAGPDCAGCRGWGWGCCGAGARVAWAAAGLRSWSFRKASTSASEIMILASTARWRRRSMRISSRRDLRYCSQVTPLFSISARMAAGVILLREAIMLIAWSTCASSTRMPMRSASWRSRRSMIRRCSTCFCRVRSSGTWMPRFCRSAEASLDASRTSRRVMTSLLTIAAIPSTNCSLGAGVAGFWSPFGAGLAGWACAADRGRPAASINASTVPDMRRRECKLRIIHTFQKSCP
ncbi:Uncharacterised protein [Bordetella pertussis]|nr:Uncharacterised protein [Bordetella pertussis]CFM35315.1 Uncharacterised protein [Bordetella pertussis]CFN12176.1 Uncharacterised protein [Bordetella pertussis]CFN54130.1 Uncharacterised protein [Bordetella pertussis]CFO37269.1 Uncharacterised protein [Bordetella pertussis]